MKSKALGAALLLVLLFSSLATANTNAQVVAPATGGALPQAQPTTELGHAPVSPLTGGCSVTLRDGTVITFSDVAPTDYFCQSARLGLTYGSISGYSGDPCTSRGLGSPCFLPYNTSTRAQFTKMLMLSFGWSVNTSGGPHFTDVQPDYWAYSYIETTYNRGIISGYTGTDCTNFGFVSPCFRPGFNVTRGEMAKMVANGADFADNTNGRTPDFYDVPASDTFFAYIERLVMHAAIAPYPPGAPPPPFCGSTLMPCFYTSQPALRADAITHIIDGADSNGYTQDFPYKDGTFDGVSAYVTTPDPPIDTSLPNNYVAAPVAATDHWNAHFIESGPEKRCNPTCALHPYGSWDDATINPPPNPPRFYWDPYIYLAPGGLYHYKSIRINGGVWQSQFCSGTGCSGMITTPDIGTSLPYVAAGGETAYLSQSFGSINISSPQSSTNGSWSSWCYNPSLTPWRTGNRSVTSCNNFSWTVNY